MPSQIKLYVLISFGIFIAFTIIILVLIVNIQIKRMLLRKAQAELEEYSHNLEGKVKERTAKIRELERQRTEIEKVAATGCMAARVAHEINNPLSGIKNSFRLIEDAVPKEHAYYSYVGRIHKEIDRIALVVRQMYSLYKPQQEAGQSFSLKEVVSDIVALQEARCVEQGLTVKLDTDDDAIAVALPENLLRQVVYNVFVNAIEASPPKGTILISGSLQDDMLKIAITDQGNGIPEEIRSRIFEPFFSTKSHLSRAGLGLGLSSTKSLVEAMKGTITYESTIGQGTTFLINIPKSISIAGVFNG